MLLGPDFGLIVIEVKGWHLDQLRSVNDHEIELVEHRSGDARIEMMPHPLRQAREYMFKTMDELKRHATLCRTDGVHLGKLAFPCGYGVVLTSITHAQIEKGGLSEVFPSDSVICRDELNSWESTDPTTLIIRLSTFFRVHFPFPSLSRRQIDLIHGTVHKAVVISPWGLTPSLPLPEPAIVVEKDDRPLAILDVEQEREAKSIGTGHRLLFGTAGSGKTVVLIAKAKLLAEQNPSGRYLFLCFNKMLSLYLEQQFAADSAFKGIEVHTFHRWVRKLTGLTFRDTNLTTVAVETSSQIRESDRYDGILVDEGQDFEADWFRCCVNALKDGEKGHLLIAVDGAQSLYGKKPKFTWKSVGVQAQGRSRRLVTNYRNTVEILEFAWAVSQAFASQIGEDIGEMERVPPRRAKRHGPVPGYLACRTTREEADQIGELVRSFLKAGTPAEHICVLYVRQEGSRIEQLLSALRRTGPICWLNDPKGPKTRQACIMAPGVKVSTVHSAKGLQSRIVIVSGLDQLPNTFDTNELADCNLLYVALTRSTDETYVTWAGRSLFTDRVMASKKVVAWRRDAG